MKDDYRRLVEDANKAIVAYYEKDDPILTDEEYDSLVRQIAAIEKEHPDWLRYDSPTRRVGGRAVAGFAKVKHPRPILSLKNGFTANDIQAFAKNAREAADGSILYVVEPKLDGLTMVCSYVNGCLESAVTRGDGLVGEDVTANTMGVKRVPVVVDYKKPFQVRGEVVMFREAFIELNRTQAQEGKHIFANARNAAAGSLRQKDPKVTRSRKLAFICYDVFGVEGEFFDEIGKLQWLNERGFQTVLSTSEAFDDVDDVIKYCESAPAWRNELPLDIDGLVIKIDKLHVQQRLGENDVYPKWALAYKFPAQHKAATLTAVEWQVGRTGRVTPVAVFTPIELGGATVDHASLHNLQYVKALDLRIGDVISVYKAAEIIPQVASVLRANDGTPIEVPTVCSACGTALVEQAMAEGTTLMCPNANCQARIIAWLTMFVSRDRMNIQGLGESLLRQLVYARLCNSPADLYELTEEALVKLPLVGQKRAQTLLKEIETSKQADAVRVLASLGVPGLGRRAAEALLLEYKTVHTLLNTPAEEIARLHGFGEAMANAFVSGLHSPSTLAQIDRLEKVGLKMALEEVGTDGEFSGQVFCITGKLSQPRDVFAKRIKEHGGKVSSSVTKDTTYLLAGSDEGRLSSKRKKANDLGTSIITEEEFEELLK